MKADARPVESKWTRFTDAYPSGPYFVGKVSLGKWETYPEVFSQCDDGDYTNSAWTHWHPAPPLPEPPFPETQADKDDEAIAKIMSEHFDMGGASTKTLCEMVLAWERAEVAKMLPAIPMPGDSMTERQLANLGMELVKAIDAIRARVGGGK